MGYEVRDGGGSITCEGRGSGTTLHLAFPSVGATENIILAAVGAHGRTKIVNAAREPEICDLADFLRSAGADITGDGSSEVIIEGGSLAPSQAHKVMPDRIVAATYASACAVCGGELLLRDIEPVKLGSILPMLVSAGCRVSERERELLITGSGRLTPDYSVRTMPYPGFPTDAQAIIMATAIKGKGISSFTETIFENRYRHVPELRKMGADIRLYGRSALVFAKEATAGALLEAHDLRGGAALVIAALAAEGESRISNSRHIGRGYQDIVAELASLGADIRRA